MSYESVVLADSPVAYWQLQSLVPPPPLPNLNCTDSSNGWNGSLLPASVANLVQGIAGPILTDSPAYGMSGGIGRIPNTGNPFGALFLPNAQTWECWSRHAGAGVEVMINRDGSNTPDTYLEWGQRSTGLFVDNAVFALDWGSGLGSFGIMSCALSRDTWHHIVGTRDGAEMKLYVDGWLVNSTSSAPASALTLNNPWRLGYMLNTVFGEVNLSTGLAHVAVYNYALTQNQIRTHTIAALGSLPSNPCGDTPTITAACPVTDGVVGVPYSSVITVTGGTAPYTFAVTSGALPNGLSLNTSTGAVTGTPTAAGTFSFVVTVTDADLLTAETPGCGIIISETPPPPDAPITRTFQFDAGIGSNWYLIPQLSDSGDELRSKQVKAAHLTGRVHNCSFMSYAYNPEQPIKMDELEAGERSYVRTVTRPQSFPDTEHVEQTRRRQVNVVGTLHTIRVEGSDVGQPERDRIEEVVYEVSEQGVRR